MSQLIERFCSFANLYDAYRKARRRTSFSLRA